MGTVRYTSSASPTPTPPSSAKKGGKRKAAPSVISATSKPKRSAFYAPSGADPDDLSVAHALAQDMLDERLASRDKWQVCTQRNLSLVRTECMNVRRELARVEEAVDTVQMHVEDGLAAYALRRDEIQQFINEQREQMQLLVEKVETAEKQAADHKDTTQRQLLKMNKRLESHVEKQQKAIQGLVDEEALLTQIAGLQERYDAELATSTSALEARFESKLTAATEAMDRKLTELQEGLRRQERDEHKHDHRSQTDSHGLREEMQLLVRRIAELEHNSDRLRSENTQLKASLESTRQQSEGLDDRMVSMARALDRHDHTLRTMPSPHHFSPPLPSHPPPPLPPPVNLGPLEQKLHFVSKDLRLMAEDYSRWKNHADSNHHMLRQEMVARIGDAQDALFKALNHDSEQHKFENHRLKDACFDTRADVIETRKELNRVRDKLEEEIRVLAQARLQSSRYESSPVRFIRRRSPSPPPSMRRRHSHGASHGSDRRVSETEMSYFGGPYIQSRDRSRSPLSPGRRSRDPSPRRGRSRSRSRSRSRGRGGPATTTSDMLYLPLNRPGTTTHARPPTEVGPMEPSHPSTRSSRRQSRTHEVIVIEDGDEDGEIASGEGTSTSSREPAPNMAPPDPVLDENDDRMSPTQLHLKYTPMTGVASASSTPVPDDDEPCNTREATVTDLRTGALLYTCFGGAPTLDREWTTYFAALRSSDCVDAAEMLRFQVRHPSVATHPPFLSQFVVKAFQVQHESIGGCPQPPMPDADATALATIDATAVSAAFLRVVETLRSDWIEMAVQYLSDALKLHHVAQGTTTDAMAMAVTLTAPPTLAPDATVETENAFLKAHWQWAQVQASALMPLVRFGLEEHASEPRSASAWDDIASFKPAPGVLVVLLCFDIVDVVAERSLDARLRLNGFGRELLSKLWERALNKVPLPLFIECPWLDDQSVACKKMPLLALAHVLSTVLLHFSPRAQLLPRDKWNVAVAHSVRLLAGALRVNGKSVTEFTSDTGGSSGGGGSSVAAAYPPLAVLGDGSQSLEIVLTSPLWAQAVDLECFADVVKILGTLRR